MGFFGNSVAPPEPCHYDMKYLITGGCGFLGSNLAAEALRQDQELCVFDNLSRLGSVANRQWLESLGEFEFRHGDISNDNDVQRVVAEFKPNVVFHLAGQVAMTTSIADPRKDFEINAQGTLNLLEAIRLHAPDAAVIYSSTNKVYGDLEWVRYEENETRFLTPDFPHGFAEDTTMEFHSPYGCSKGSADQYMQDYARIFGLNTLVFRHSSMYGGRQFSTYDQGWIGWFCQQALETLTDPSRDPFTISGTGKQVRDVLHAQDMISLYFAATPYALTGGQRVMNIGGGMDNSLSLLELFDLLEELTDSDLKFTRLPPRESDQKVFVADIERAQSTLNWTPQVSAREGVSQMLDWLRTNR